MSFYGSYYHFTILNKYSYSREDILRDLTASLVHHFAAKSFNPETKEFFCSIDSDEYNSFYNKTTVLLDGGHYLDSSFCKEFDLTDFSIKYPLLHFKVKNDFSSKVYNSKEYLNGKLQSSDEKD